MSLHGHPSGLLSSTLPRRSGDGYRPAQTFPSFLPLVYLSLWTCLGLSLPKFALLLEDYAILADCSHSPRNFPAKQLHGLQSLPSLTSSSHYAESASLADALLPLLTGDSRCYSATRASWLTRLRLWQLLNSLCLLSSKSNAGSPDGGSVPTIASPRMVQGFNQF